MSDYSKNENIERIADALESIAATLKSLDEPLNMVVEDSSPTMRRIREVKG